MQCSELVLLESTTGAQEENTRCERVTPAVVMEGNHCWKAQLGTSAAAQLCDIRQRELKSLGQSVKPLWGDTRQEHKLQGLSGDLAPCPSPAGVFCGESKAGW